MKHLHAPPADLADNKELATADQRATAKICATAFDYGESVA